MKSNQQCKFFIQGSCKYGSNCFYIHSNTKKFNSNNSNVIDNQKTLPSNSLEPKINSSINNLSKPFEKLEINSQNDKKLEGLNYQSKTYPDFSKTELGKEIFEKNNKIWGESGFLSYIQSLSDAKDKEIAQIQRKYQASFILIRENPLFWFQIRHTPTLSPENIGNSINISEGYLWLEFRINKELYPNESSLEVRLINSSLSDYIKQGFAIEFVSIFTKNNRIFDSLREMDNTLDKIFLKIDQKRNDSNWTQSQQLKLESAMIKYKEIKDAKQKWKLISEEVIEKTIEACIQRFKYCREQAQASKTIEFLPESNINDDNINNEELSDQENSISQSESEKSESESEEINPQLSNQEKSLDKQYNIPLNIEILINEMKSTNVATAFAEETTVLVYCEQCKNETELILRPKSKDFLTNELPCLNCGTAAIILFQKQFLHSSNNRLAKAGSCPWKVIDLLKLSLILTCEACNFENNTLKIIAGGQISLDCRGCFKKIEFSLQSFTIQYIQADFSQYSKKPQKITQSQIPIFKKKKLGNFKLGQPLPNNGVCKHYKHSFRYFRFPCCGKALGCDECHLEEEKHEMEIGKNMICGFCSYEQTVKEQCMRCGKMLCKAEKGTHWEGGKGCRNKIVMSRSDPHKYKGLNKTISKKKNN